MMMMLLFVVCTVNHGPRHQRYCCILCCIYTTMPFTPKWRGTVYAHDASRVYIYMIYLVPIMVPHMGQTDDNPDHRSSR